MDFRKTNTFLLSIVALLLIITCLVLIKILFTATKGFEWGSVTDWLSALANLTMAGAAVYAAYIAKNWLKPNLQQQGLHKIIGFLQNDLSSLVNERIDYIHVISVIDRIEWIKKNIIFYPGEKQRRLNDTIKEIKEEILPTNSRIRKITSSKHFNSLISDLEWYGYAFNKDKKDTVELILIKLKNIDSITFNIQSQIQKLYDKDLQNAFIQSQPSDYNNVYKMLDSIIDSIAPYSKKLDDEFAEFQKMKEKLSLKSSSITDFFELKK